MYGVVLIAAMVSSAPGCDCGCGSGPRICCPAHHGCCGVIQFFWSGADGVAGSPANDPEWAAYVEALREPERSDVIALWKKSDFEGRMKLLSQVREMQAPKKVPEADRAALEAEGEARRTARNRR